LDYGLREGSHYHITHGSHGKAIAAFLPEDRREALLSGDRLEFFGAGELVDLRRLRKEIATVRERGYAVDSGETNPGMIVMSAPVFKYTGTIIGAVILTGGFMHAKVEEHGPLVAETARNISKRLTCQVGASPRPE
jgi:DNA-binding IclR family transcriptional regulator